MKLDASIARSFPLFAQLADADLQRVIAFAAPRLVVPGSSVFEQGQVASHFYLLASGRLKVTQLSNDGQQIIVRVVHPGDLFGFAKALQRQDYPGTAIAAIESLVIGWPMSLWQPLVQNCPHLALIALNTIGQRLEEAHTRIREMSTQEIEQRIAQTLLRLAKSAGHREGDGVRIAFPLSRQDIAEMTGSTLHYVSRILSAWEHQSFIRSGRRTITIVNSDRLRAIASPSD